MKNILLVSSAILLSVSAAASSLASSADGESYHRLKSLDYTVIKPVKLHNKGSGIHTSIGHIPIKINGFASAGAAINNTSAGYNIPGHGTVGNDLSFGPSSLIGLQLEADITSRLAVITQFVANGDNSNGNNGYSVRADWAFLRYSVTKNLQVRGGRFRAPFFFYSDTMDVGYTYPWTFLPNEVYRVVPFYNMNGGDVIYSHALGHTGYTVKVQPFIGANSSEFDVSLPAMAPLTKGRYTGDFDENNIVGGQVTISSSIFTVHAAIAHAELNGSIPISSLPSGSVTLFRNKGATFYSLGEQLNVRKFVSTSELAYRATFSKLASLLGFYSMVGYHCGKFLPNFTYGYLHTTNVNQLKSAKLVSLTTLIQGQQSFTAGVAYYINSHVVTKASYSYIDTLQGSNGLFDGSLGKSGGSLYVVSADVVF